MSKWMNDEELTETLAETEPQHFHKKLLRLKMTAPPVTVMPALPLGGRAEPSLIRREVLVMVACV